MIAANYLAAIDAHRVVVLAACSNSSNSSHSSSTTVLVAAVQYALHALNHMTLICKLVVVDKLHSTYEVCHANSAKNKSYEAASYTAPARTLA